MRIGIDYTAAVRQRAGIGRYTRELIAALLRLESPYEYRIFAAVGGLGPRALDLRPRPGVRLCPVPLSDEWLARLWQRLRLPLPVEWVTGPLDIFYSPDFVLPPTRRGTRTLLTVHDLSFVHYPQHFVPRLVEYLNRSVRQAVARADRVLADSQATRADLLAHFGVPPRKVTVLYSGVDERFQPEPEPGERDRLRARYGVGERPYILSVGTLQPRKNFERLIEAWARMPPSCGADVELVIAGQRGWLCEGILERAGAHGGRVRLLGFVAEPDLPALYRQAAVFAFPSYYEGFGLPVLEALACGVPVVCSNASSLPEVAGEAALLVAPGDTEELSAALTRALEDSSLRQRLIQAGRVQATRFTWEAAARQLLACLEDLGG